MEAIQDANASLFNGPRGINGISETITSSHDTNFISQLWKAIFSKEGNFADLATLLQFSNTSFRKQKLAHNESKASYNDQLIGINTICS